MTHYDYAIGDNTPHVIVYKTDADGDVDKIVKVFDLTPENVILAISMSDRLNKEENHVYTK